MSEPDTPQFIDTNVLVYAHDNSAGRKYARAAKLLGRLWESGTGCLSLQVLQEFYVTITQKVAKPLSPEVAAQIIGDLSAWQVHRPTVQDLLDAIRIQNRYKISFWDAMIVASALQLNCQTIWSEDLSTGQVYDRVQVRNPF